MSRAQFMPFWTGKGAKMAAPTTVREREGAKGPKEVQTARQDAGTEPSFAAGQAGEAFQEGTVRRTSVLQCRFWKGREGRL